MSAGCGALSYVAGLEYAQEGERSPESNLFSSAESRWINPDHPAVISKGSRAAERMRWITWGAGLGQLAGIHDVFSLNPSACKCVWWG